MWLREQDELAALIRRYPGSGLVSTGNYEIAAGATWNSIPRRPSNIRQSDYFREAARWIGGVNSSLCGGQSDRDTKVRPDIRDE
jgi:hypothetical protein